jgi:hypothetical protein
MTTHYLDLYQHESLALSERRLGVIVRMVEKQPKSTVSGPNFDGLWYETNDPVTRYFADPFGPPGTVLACREAFRWWNQSGIHYADLDGGDHDYEWTQRYVAYEATPRVGMRVSPDVTRVCFLDESTPLESNMNLLGPWLPAVEAPDWAIRHRPTVGDVTCKRVQDVTEEEAKAYGILMPDSTGAPDDRHNEPPEFWSYRKELAFTWDDFHGAGSWDQNPWVWVATINPHTT